MNIIAGISVSVAVVVVAFVFFAPNMFLQSLEIPEQPSSAPATSTLISGKRTLQSSSGNVGSKFVAPGFRGPSGLPHVKSPTSPPPNY